MGVEGKRGGVVGDKSLSLLSSQSRGKRQEYLYFKYSTGFAIFTVILTVKGASVRDWDLPEEDDQEISEI